VSDLKTKRELSRINKKKCKFCNCLNYVKPECKTKKGITIGKMQSQNLMEAKPELTSVKKNQLEMLDAEQEEQ